MPEELRDGGGACVLQTEEPLEQAIKFLRPLQALAPENVETHTQAYDIYSRKGGWILTLCAEVLVGRDTLCAEVQVGGSIVCAEVQVGGSIVCAEVQVGGSIVCAEVQVGGSIVCAEVQVGGSIVCAEVQVGLHFVCWSPKEKYFVVFCLFGGGVLYVLKSLGQVGFFGGRG